MEDNLLRVESAVSATSSGNLTWELWTHDCATALGLAGHRNPLGFAVVRYLSDGPNSTATWGLVLQLATELIRRGHDKAQANDTAWRALYAWNQKSCSHCGGRGVISFDQKPCPVCKGSGERDQKDWPEVVREGLSCLLEAERWMEGQLAARLRGSHYTAPHDGYKVNLPRRDSQDDLGFDRDPRTPKRQSDGFGG